LTHRWLSIILLPAKCSFLYHSDHLRILNEAPRSKVRGIKAELRRSQPVFALVGFDAVRPAIHPCSKLRGILAKANK